MVSFGTDHFHSSGIQIDRPRPYHELQQHAGFNPRESATGRLSASSTQILRIRAYYMQPTSWTSLLTTIISLPAIGFTREPMETGSVSSAVPILLRTCAEHLP